MGFTLETGVSIFTVFFQGLLSFFSPCVLPLVPLYISYLAGGTKSVDEAGNIRYRRGRVMGNTLCFVLGVSFAFFLLGFGFTAAGRFFGDYRVWFARIGGVLVVLFGLYQLGVFGSGLLGREHRLPFRLDKLAMNPLLALLMGFTFSFAWTPCVGPALASVLLMASSAATALRGYLLVGVYTLGFVLPFLAVGLFTGTLLDFFKRHQNVVKYTVKVGGVLMILMGVMMFTGWMNGVTGYLSGVGNGAPVQSAAPPSSPQPSHDPDVSGGEEPTEKVAAPDFTLVDQFGEEHTLSDYKGKTVFLNFWATWCGPCQAEMPDIQGLYERYGENQEDLVVLGVANPRSDGYPGNIDKPQEEVEQYLADLDYTYPVVMDLTGKVFADYYVGAYPTTFMVDEEGNLFGYVQGTLTSSMMESIVRQTMGEE